MESLTHALTAPHASIPRARVVERAAFRQCHVADTVVLPQRHSAHDTEHSFLCALMDVIDRLKLSIAHR